jgi:hypothetical protein
MGIGVKSWLNRQNEFMGLVGLDNDGGEWRGRGNLGTRHPESYTSPQLTSERKPPSTSSYW